MAKKLGFINLRKELATLRDHVGFRWTALRSADLNTPCIECSKKVPAQYDQVSGTCKSCLGIGYAYMDKLVPAFSYLGQPGFDFLSQIGFINTKTRVYIIEYGYKPKNTDYIMELDLDESTGIPRQPFVVTRTFKIQDSEVMRGGEPTSHVGAIDFWRCYVEERNLDLTSKTVQE